MTEDINENSTGAFCKGCGALVAAMVNHSRPAHEFAAWKREQWRAGHYVAAVTATHVRRDLASCTCSKGVA